MSLLRPFVMRSPLLMRSPFSDPARPPLATRAHPPLTSTADEACATVARLFAYLGTLALVGMLAVRFFQQWPETAASHAASPGWSAADRPDPAFAVGARDGSDGSVAAVAYTVLRHPAGGRKDIFRWETGAARPRAELEIYRMGDEGPAAPPAAGDLSLRMPKGPTAELEPAGVLDSKLGTFALLRRASASDGPGACLGFFREIDDPSLRISGWSCEGASLPERRRAVACMLDRLTIVSGAPRLAELFARAETRRQGCGAPEPAAAGDWITDAENPPLHGPL